MSKKLDASLSPAGDGSVDEVTDVGRGGTFLRRALGMNLLSEELSPKHLASRY